MIKTYLKLVALILGVVFITTSCEEDSDSSKVAGNKYETTYSSMVMSGGGFNMTIELKTKEELIENESYEVLEFTTDGKLYIDEVYVANYTESGDKVTLTDGAGNTIILDIDGNTLVYSLSETEIEDGVTYTISTTTIYTKM